MFENKKKYKKRVFHCSNHYIYICVFLRSKTTFSCLGRYFHIFWNCSKFMVSLKRIRKTLILPLPSTFLSSKSKTTLIFNLTLLPACVFNKINNHRTNQYEMFFLFFSTINLTKELCRQTRMAKDATQATLLLQRQLMEFSKQANDGFRYIYLAF